MSQKKKLHIKNKKASIVGQSNNVDHNKLDDIAQNNKSQSSENRV